MAMHDKSSACILYPKQQVNHISQVVSSHRQALRSDLPKKSQSPLARQLIIYTFVFGLALIFCGPRSLTAPTRISYKIKFSGVSVDGRHLNRKIYTFLDWIRLINRSDFKADSWRWIFDAAALCINNKFSAKVRARSDHDPAPRPICERDAYNSSASSPGGIFCAHATNDLCPFVLVPAVGR